MPRKKISSKPIKKKGKRRSINSRLASQRNRSLHNLIEGLKHRQYRIDVGLDKIQNRNESILRCGERELERLDDLIIYYETYQLISFFRDVSMGYRRITKSKKGKKSATRRSSVIP